MRSQVGPDVNCKFVQTYIFADKFKQQKSQNLQNNENEEAFSSLNKKKKDIRTLIKLNLRIAC